MPDPVEAGAPPSNLVWQVCHHMRGLRQSECRRCPPREETGYGLGTRGCYSLAEEIVNLVQTGHPRRAAPGAAPDMPP